MIFTAISLVAGIWAIMTYAAEINEIGNLLQTHGRILYTAVCILVLLAALLAGRVAAWCVEKGLKLVLLNWVNKGIGAMVGLVAAAVFLSFAVYAGCHVPKDKPLLGNEQVKEAKLVKYFEKAGGYLPGISWIESYPSFIQPRQRSPEG